MPAVTVENLLVLPRVAEPAPEGDRPVVSVTTAPAGFEGEGFPVRRAFAGVSLADLDPFIHMDQMGEVEYAPGEPKGTPWHPHRGFETVTYIIDGIFRHQDSNGGGGPDHERRHAVDDRRGRHPAHRGSARGAGHERRPLPRLPALGQPAGPAEDDPAALPGHPGGPGRAADLEERRRAAARHRRRASTATPDPGSTHTPISLVPRHRLAPARRSPCPGEPTSTPSATCSPARAPSAGSAARCAPGRLAIFGFGESITFAADATMDGPSPALDILLLGGEPIREPVVMATVRSS